MNIRPYLNALRKEWPGGIWFYTQNHIDKTRIVTIQQLFRKKATSQLWRSPWEPVQPTDWALRGDRFIRIQLWDMPGLVPHRVSHMVVTKDCPISLHGPHRLQGTTPPTDFTFPRGMIHSVVEELMRNDHSEHQRGLV